jgi:hypothetical protein
VPSDGNCLYHALSDSHLFIDKNPGLKDNTFKLRKSLSECIRCTQNKEFVEHLLTNYKPGNANSIAQWAGQVEEDSTWGSNSVAAMFTYLFGLNVVVVLQLVKGISAFGKKKKKTTKLLFIVLSLQPIWLLDPDTALIGGQWIGCQSGRRSCF